MNDHSNLFGLALADAKPAHARGMTRLLGRGRDRQNALERLDGTEGRLQLPIFEAAPMDLAARRAMDRNESDFCAQLLERLHALDFPNVERAPVCRAGQAHLGHEGLLQLSSIRSVRLATLSKDVPSGVNSPIGRNTCGIHMTFKRRAKAVTEGRVAA